MFIATFFESVFASTIVIFSSSCINRCFVNKALRKAAWLPEEKDAQKNSQNWNFLLNKYDGKHIYLRNQMKLMMQQHLNAFEKSLYYKNTTWIPR